MLLLVLGLVGIFTGCDLIDDLVGGKIENWEWEPLNWEDGQSYTYDLKADPQTGTITVGSMDIEISSAGGGNLEMEVSGNFGGEAFSATSVGNPYDQEEFLHWFGDILDELELQMGEENFEFFVDIFGLFTLHQFVGVFVEDETLHVGFTNEFILYSEIDPDQVLVTRTINIPGLKEHLGVQGYLVDVVWTIGEDDINQIWNLLISFDGPTKMNGKIYFYDEGEIDRSFSIELTSFSG